MVYSSVPLTRVWQGSQALKGQTLNDSWSILILLLLLLRIILIKKSAWLVPFMIRDRRIWLPLFGKIPTIWAPGMYAWVRACTRACILHMSMRHEDNEENQYQREDKIQTIQLVDNPIGRRTLSKGRGKRNLARIGKVTERKNYRVLKGPATTC